MVITVIFHLFCHWTEAFPAVHLKIVTFSTFQCANYYLDIWWGAQWGVIFFRRVDGMHLQWSLFATEK